MLGWYLKTDTDNSYILSNSRHTVTRRYTNTEVDKMRSKIVPGHPMEVYRGKRATAPLILHIGAGWRCVLNIRSQLPYPRERIPVPNEKEAQVGGGQSRSEHFGKRENLLILPRSEPRTIQWRSTCKINTAASPLQNSNISACSSVPLKQMCRINALKRG